jgi:hypothetical protein
LLRESYNQITEEVEEEQDGNNIILYVVLAVVVVLAIIIITLYLARLDNRKKRFVHNLRARDQGNAVKLWGQKRKPITEHSKSDMCNIVTEAGVP